MVDDHSRSCGAERENDKDGTVGEGSGPTSRDEASSGGPRIVAIGASAGGLEPREKFIEAMPPETGLAFVVIQHLSPDFRSMMDELLTRHSSMNIFRVKDGMEVAPNAIYLNLPRQELTVVDGRFVLEQRDEEQGFRLPIDSFFESLASEAGADAICVVLSGTGSDGTLGSKAIRGGFRREAQRDQANLI